MIRARAAGSLAVAAVIAAACSESGTVVQPVVACDSTSALATSDAFARADVEVAVDSSDPLLDPVRADLGRYLAAMWGGR